MLTHQNVLACLEAFQSLLPRWPGQQWLDQERFGNVIPLSHVYGLIMMTLMPLSLGGAVVLLPRFSPSSTLKAIEDFGVTFFGGVPRMYAMLNHYQYPGRYSRSSCRFWICGGSPLPANVSERFHATYGATIREGFGMLETSSLATLNFDDAPRHPGSVGPFAGTMRARIRDPQGRDLGPTVMKGYYRDPGATAGVLRDGWLATGDIGILDDDGYLYLKGRSKDMMIVGGHNVYPREVEQVLLRANEVADAAVAAQDDPVRGERIVAFVVAAPGRIIDEKILLDHCRRHLSSFKCPRQVLVVDDIPRNATGKVLRQVLSERLGDGGASPPTC